MGPQSVCTRYRDEVVQLGLYVPGVFAAFIKGMVSQRASCEVVLRGIRAIGGMCLWYCPHCGQQLSARGFPSDIEVAELLRTARQDSQAAIMVDIEQLYKGHRDYCPDCGIRVRFGFPW